MAKISSKPPKTASRPKKSKSAKIARFCPKWLKTALKPLRKQIRRFKAWRSERLHLHRSFRRSYREDYRRDTNTPGLLTHAVQSFQLIFRHWKTFIPLILLATGLFIALVGIMSEDFYKQYQDSIDSSSENYAFSGIGNFAKAGMLLFSTVTTGGLDSGMDDVGAVFTVIIFLVLWLVTVFLLRHYYAGGKPKLRDALYNALAPLVPTALIFAVVFVQAIPLMLVVITYNAAVVTGFLATPFYALVYFIFAATMILLSVYLLASSLMAMVAVTAPGVYPLVALSSASDLIAGRRTRLVIRLLYLVVVVAFIYLVLCLPVFLLDLVLKPALGWDWLTNVPIAPFMLLLTTCFVFVYAATYLYKYYRYLLDYQEK